MTTTTHYKAGTTRNEEDPFEAEERVRWQEEEGEAKPKYFKMIAEEEERGYFRQTVSPMIEESSAAKRKKREMEKKSGQT